MNIQAELSNRIDGMRGELLALLRELIRIPSYPCTREQNLCLDVINDCLDLPNVRIDRWRPNWGEVEKITALSNGADLYVPNTGFLSIRDEIGVLVAEYGNGPKSIALNGHIDVVGVEPCSKWTVDPFSGYVRDGKVYGRGAADMKGGLVASIVAFKALAESGIELPGRVQLQTVPEEETGGNGTLACIARGYRPDAVVFSEPTDLHILYRHTGIQDFQVEITGYPGIMLSHSSGVDSVTAMGRVILAIEALQNEREAEARRRDPLFGKDDSPAFITIGSVRAGEWHASIPMVSRLQGFMGLLPDEQPREALAQLERAVRSAVSGIPWFEDNPPKVISQSDGHLSASLIENHPLVQAFAGASNAFGIRPDYEGLMVCDAKITQGGGFSPSIAYGPVGRCLHSADEYVELDSIITVAKVTAVGVVNYLQGGSFSTNLSE